MPYTIEPTFSTLTPPEPLPMTYIRSPEGELVGLVNNSLAQAVADALNSNQEAKADA